jgi:hypothetical protein
MSEMIERVTAAIDAVLGDAHESLSIEMGCGSIAAKLRAEAMAEAARAAIGAMQPEFRRCYSLGLEHGSGDAIAYAACIGEDGSKSGEALK